MPYLTYEEFQRLTSDELSEGEFIKLLPKASAVLDNVTSQFYVRYPMSLDNPWRVKQFKLALSSQIEYFNALGTTTFEGINSSPQSFSAGRTRVSNASRFNPAGENESKSLVAEEVFMFLEGTGLTFSGVSTW
ncbi:hypothetical protein [Planomicrobium sp. YIM 101495]|uniref:hypothetical protein n=1 Tax=Planomicrobium sp. YIM 101495 TaxID=2665160 RepID=UPI0012B9EC67|nr:hypothetical protein [Planomicrobium sp. YIM 101495]MTD30163.1 hypothetical protein [Planomicrobium sp. YIM 101495]